MKGILKIITEYIVKNTEAIDINKCILYLSLRKKAYINKIIPV